MAFTGARPIARSRAQGWEVQRRSVGSGGAGLPRPVSPLPLLPCPRYWPQAQRVRVMGARLSGPTLSVLQSQPPSDPRRKLFFFRQFRRPSFLGVLLEPRIADEPRVVVHRGVS
jgi:hypothetical protein